MSLSRGCIIAEIDENRWYCVVAHDEYDYDFTSGSTVYGPCASEDEAFQAMADRECNPGESVTIPFGEIDQATREIIHAGRKARS